MKVVTAEEMRNIDVQTMQEVGIPGVVLMENAGLGVVRAIEERWRDKGTGGQRDARTHCVHLRGEGQQRRRWSGGSAASGK